MHIRCQNADRQSQENWVAIAQSSKIKEDLGDILWQEMKCGYLTTHTRESPTITGIMPLTFTTSKKIQNITINMESMATVYCDRMGPLLVNLLPQGDTINAGAYWETLKNCIGRYKTNGEEYWYKEFNVESCQSAHCSYRTAHTSQQATITYLWSWRNIWPERLLMMMMRSKSWLTGAGGWFLLCRNQEACSLIYHMHWGMF